MKYIKELFIPKLIYLPNSSHFGLNIIHIFLQTKMQSKIILHFSLDQIRHFSVGFLRRRISPPGDKK